jgi:hypothetical protein
MPLPMKRPNKSCRPRDLEKYCDARDVFESVSYARFSFHGKQKIAETRNLLAETGCWR